MILQVDILCRALDKEEEGHMMCALPTGYGKSLPMLLLGLLMPEGRTWWFGQKEIWHESTNYFLSYITGSTVIIVVPLHTIESQLVLECGRLGIPAMAGSQVNVKSFTFSWGIIWAKLPQIVPKEFDAAMSSRPKLLVCSVEFLADSQVGGVHDPICQLFNSFQVRKVIMKNRLSPAGTRPIVCIDEAQVLLSFSAGMWAMTKQYQGPWS